MNKSLKNKIVNGTIDFVIFIVVFCITEAIIDIIMGWDLWDISSRTTSQALVVISIACAVNGLVFTVIGHYRSKRYKKNIDEQYGKLFDEAGISCVKTHVHIKLV